MISLFVRSIRSPMLLPLFKMDLWVKHAAFGIEVVLHHSYHQISSSVTYFKGKAHPLVNWIFTTSSRLNLSSLSCGRPNPSVRASGNEENALNDEASIRPCALFTTMTPLSEGTSSDSQVVSSEGTSCRSSGTFDRGDLRERFVSRDTIRWEALR